MAEWPINDTVSKVFPLYSRANVGEIFPDPISPLNASAGFQHNLEPGWRDAFVACKVWDHDLYDANVEKNILPAFGSYLYINMSLMRLFGVRVPGMSPEAVDLQYFGDMPGIPSYESEKRDFDENPDFAARAGSWLVEEVIGATGLPEYDADRQDVLRIRADRPDMSTLTDQQLRERITSFDYILRPLFKRHIEASLKSGVGLGAVAQIAAAVGRPELALTLVGGIGDVDSTGPSKRMWTLSRAAQDSAVAAVFDEGVTGLYDRLAASTEPSVVQFRADLDAFLSDWDFRGPAEWEIRAQTWGVKPELALGTIDRMRQVGENEAPEGKGTIRGEEREAAAALVRELLAGDPETLAQFEATLSAAALWLRGRERARTTAAMVIHEIRLPARELGRRGVEAGALDSIEQIFMLFADELDAYIANPAAFTYTLREREKSYISLFDVKPPFVVSEEVPPLENWELRSGAAGAMLTTGESIVGVSGCTGTARGVARVLTSPDDPSALEPGEILIAPITDPSWTPLFVAASAVVVDVGAPFSHAAIVSREIGIPCIVSATDATKRIPNGALVEVDGTTGIVTVIDTP
ncbi:MULTISPECIES: PEP-utilizing enzyme [Rhodococcus]|uniref:PEP-utilizing enzyme n=1 Tax=Rhodococcus oxybenzonivorans TaxID=1990687 RepID=A0AAE5A4Y3_9NOCA|nr:MULTISPECIES: PEP-utilizing enzyme [Rhodococcus]MDV7243647.1 PEP-utilizing enzyme [Rhodococcus oxybenzonivorans]MDV7264290.1 PEP-utilizing enzyme [Rhodococcus oxybenzonivorans]MDV7275111.1 PEP-utilizing enzyme [Rhodococcus oxybenzonivorans]MDV7335349.1 PEP-utilizing enzyme [Rhodococcus oxybenzonivorans]MDV7346060.1 PEP-utilizing enzyme [Rhodococcus oxybenzonivorans]